MADLKENKKNKELTKGLGMDAEDYKRAVAVPYVIDTDKRKVGDGKVNKSEPKMTE